MTIVHTEIQEKSFPLFLKFCQKQASIENISAM